MTYGSRGSPWSKATSTSSPTSGSTTKPRSLPAPAIATRAQCDSALSASHGKRDLHPAELVGIVEVADDRRAPRRARRADRPARRRRVTRPSIVRVWRPLTRNAVWYPLSGVVGVAARRERVACPSNGAPTLARLTDTPARSAGLPADHAVELGGRAAELLDERVGGILGDLARSPTGRSAFTSVPPLELAWRASAAPTPADALRDASARLGRALDRLLGLVVPPAHLHLLDLFGAADRRPQAQQVAAGHELAGVVRVAGRRRPGADAESPGSRRCSWPSATTTSWPISAASVDRNSQSVWFHCTTASWTTVLVPPSPFCSPRRSATLPTMSPYVTSRWVSVVVPRCRRCAWS